MAGVGLGEQDERQQQFVEPFLMEWRGEPQEFLPVIEERERKCDWEFVWSEIKCYGKYIAPIVLINAIILVVLILYV